MSSLVSSRGDGPHTEQARTHFRSLHGGGTSPDRFGSAGYSQAHPSVSETPQLNEKPRPGSCSAFHAAIASAGTRSSLTPFAPVEGVSRPFLTTLKRNRPWLAPVSTRGIHGRAPIRSESPAHDLAHPSNQPVWGEGFLNELRPGVQDASHVAA